MRIGLPYLGIITPGGQQYSAEYQALLDYAQSQGYQLPTTQNRIAQNNLLVTLKSSGILDLLDVFRVYATNGDSDFSRLNWKDALLYKALEVSSPIYTRKSGYSGNTTSSYLNSSFIPSSNGVNYQRDNCAILAGILNNVSSSSYFDWGASDASLADRTILNSRQASSQAAYAVSASTARVATNSDSIGDWIVQRRGSTDMRLWRNGVQLDSFTTASTGVPNVTFYELAENRNGVAAGFSGRINAYFGAGASLAGLESAFYDAWTTYYNSLSEIDEDEVQILYKGDSITAGVGPTYANGSYPVLTSNKLNTHINNSIIGTPNQTVSQMLALKAELDPYLAYADIFVLFGGVNDILLATPRTAAAIWADLLALVNYAKSFGVTKIAMGTVMDSSNFDAARDTIRDDLNTLIRDNAAANGITVMDFHANPNLAVQNATYYSDHVHLNNAGTDIQSTIAKDAILPLL